MPLSQLSSNSSHTSLAGISSAQYPTGSVLNGPTFRQPSLFSQQTQLWHANDSLDLEENPSLPSKSSARYHQDIERRKQVDKTDAQWEEMQSTLAQVELSAANNMHMLGSEHEKALEGLRTAQIELAKAWARSEADETSGAAENMAKNTPGKKFRSSSEDKTAGTTVTGASGRPKSPAATPGLKLDGVNKHQSEPDIVLARKRREANDKYFQRVNDSVLDVVARLEAVACAMREVERESRDIWGDTDNESSKTTVNYHRS
ncbi:hypothetical protein K3495_g9233 [Podosphaera aphanis]|nr:hypothetical protein K3495_g9233 [Podosphaera aphanis]